MTAFRRKVSYISLGKIAFTLLLLVSVLMPGLGQNKLIQHQLIISTDADTTLTEQTTIVPESVELVSSQDKTWSYAIDNNQITFSTSSKDRDGAIQDTIALSYRVLAENLGESEAIMDPEDLKKKSKIIKIANDYTREEDIERRLIESNKLKYTGSFTRGVNVGNNQDVVLQSDFNIQMEGDLGNGLSVRAAISDDNIPIQPQGNTQVLQEFDKVFIELTKDRTSVIAGDYELSRPDSYFMNYFKKLQGISISNESTINDNWKLSNRGSFAISRGPVSYTHLTLPTIYSV